MSSVFWKNSVIGLIKFNSIRSRNEEVVKFLLDKGAAVSITLKDFVEFNANEVKGLSYGYDSSGPDSIKDNFKRRVEQPIEACVIEMPSMAKVLIEAGADPSTVLSKAYSYGFNYRWEASRF